MAATPAPVAIQNPLFQHAAPRAILSSAAAAATAPHVIIYIRPSPSCVERTIYCQFIAIILILLIAILSTYFANGESFRDWQLVMYVALVCITVAYICSCCIYHRCKGEADDRN
jgi:hypothetical protein